MTNHKNLEAIRAKAAFEFAKNGNKKQEEDANFNYSAAVQELPAIIRMNGLRAAMAFFYSKKDQHQEVFLNVRDWFYGHDPNGVLKPFFIEPQPTNNESKATVFMNLLVKIENDEYRDAQADILALASWMIRFVKQNSSNDATD